MKAVFGILTGIVLWAQAGAVLAQERLEGLYLGIEDATGASIQIAPDRDGFQGTFFDAAGQSQQFAADRDGDAAEAVLDMDGRTVLMRMDPLPFGAQVSIIPFDRQGRLVFDAGRVLAFVREGTKLPEQPPDFIDAPRRAGDPIAGNGFLASYEFWDPTGVRNGYLGLPERFKTLLRMFPAVQLDVIWKLCLAPGADQALAVALRGQGVACNEVIDTMARLQRNGRFATYKAEVHGEKDTLRTSVRCADGYVESKQACDEASRALSRAAISLKTAATVLSRYR